MWDGLLILQTRHRLHNSGSSFSAARLNDGLRDRPGLKYSSLKGDLRKLIGVRI